MPSLKDRTGKRFGKLVALYHYLEKSRYPNGRSKVYWMCACDCGKEAKVDVLNLVAGHTKSCGCLINNDNTAFFSLYANYKHSAKEGNRVFTLTKERFKELTSSVCHYCGLEPIQEQKYNGNKGSASGPSYIYNGLDRVDTSKGYSEDNVVSCCGTCNRAKLAMSKEEFLSWIDRVYEWQKKGDQK